MPRLDVAPPASRAGRSLTSAPGPFADHLEARAGNRLHAEPGAKPGAGSWTGSWAGSWAEPAPARIIEIGEEAAGIAVPERGGVRFFSSARDFDALDGTVFRSVEQAARAARDRFRHVAAGGRGARPERRRLAAV